MDNLMSPPPTPKSEPQEQTMMNFYDALKEVAQGKVIRRQSWPTEDFALMVDFLLSIHTNGETKHWIISEGDMEGTDWIVANG